MTQPEPPYRDPAPRRGGDRWNPRAVRAFRGALVSVLLVPALLAGASALFSAVRFGDAVGTAVLLTVVGASLTSLVLGVGAAKAGLAVRREVPSFPTPERGRGLATAAVPLGVLGAVMQLLGFFFACVVVPVIGRGRQVRRLGRAVLPPVRPGGAWATRPLALAVDAPAREALAARWRENGRTEHASVAAFARLALDLVAVGAPPALLAAAQRDALDEVRHAELCFSVARALDGRDEGVGPFPEAARTTPPSRLRAVALAELAVASLVDGALHEGVSARIAAALARRCEEPGLRDVLKEIAADEGRHAAHGWDVVEWCAAEGGDAVVRALLGALEGIPARAREGRSTAADEGAWERWGVHGHALEAGEYRRAYDDLAARVRRLAGARP